MTPEALRLDKRDFVALSHKDDVSTSRRLPQRGEFG
jgi:hypothetical protein